MLLGRTGILFRMTESKNNSVLADKQITIKGTELHYHEELGMLPNALIFVHGIGVSSRYMLPLAQELSSHNSVYAIDLPGFGKSKRPKEPYSINLLAEYLDLFIQQNKISSPILIGNSFGCQVIIQFLKTFPNSASKAILIGPTMNMYERSHTMQMARWVQNLKNEPTNKLAWVLMKDIFECGVFRVARALNLGIKDCPEQGLNKVNMPILFVRGELDPIAPKRWLDFLAQQSPLFSVAELPGAGHAANFNSPKPMADIINRYIAVPVRA